MTARVLWDAMRTYKAIQIVQDGINSLVMVCQWY